MKDGAEKQVPIIPIILLGAALIAFLLLRGGSEVSEVAVTSAPYDEYEVMDVAIEDVGGVRAAPAVMMKESSGADSLASARGISPAAPSVSLPHPGYYPPSYEQPISITDTREFLKKSYSANFRTRDVQALTRRGETTIRGFGGRVDHVSSTEKYGSIAFVLPENELEAFRDEVENFVDSRFITISISSQNRIGEKVALETQKGHTSAAISELNARRTRLIEEHGAAIRSLNTSIAQSEEELRDAQNLLRSGTLNSENVLYVLSRVQELEESIASLNAELSRENASYRRSRDVLDAQIAGSTMQAEHIDTQDQQLLDDVATVNGTLTFAWISYWHMTQAYLPGYWIPGILVLLALLAFAWQRHTPPPLS